MSNPKLPWSFYAVLVSFGIFFASLNIYLLTLFLQHPLASPLWLIGVVIGLVALLFSVRMVRIHQAILIEQKRARTENQSE